jgi:hypothetical protein
VVKAPFATAVSIACLGVFGVLCYVVAALLAALLATSLARGDGPDSTGIVVSGALFAVAGWACRRLAAWLSPSAS